MVVSPSSNSIHSIHPTEKNSNVCLSAVSASRRCTLCVTQLLSCKRKRQPVCSFVFLYCFNSKYGLLTRRKVKMAGYWPRFMDRGGVKIHKHAKGTRPTSSNILTELAWLIKGLSSGKRTLFSCGTERVIPSKQDSVSCLLGYPIPAQDSVYLARNE